MKYKALCAAATVALSIGLTTSVHAQDRHPDAADLAEPQSPVTQLLGSLSLEEDEPTAAAPAPAPADDRPSAATKGETKPAPDQSEAQLAGVDNTGRKSTGAQIPTQVPPAKPVVRSAAAEAAPKPVAASREVAAHPVAQPAAVAPPSPAPVLIPDAAIERAPAPKVTLNPRERYFLQREAELVREIRLLELQAKAAELQKQVDAGDNRGLPMAPVMNSSNGASAGLPFAEDDKNSRPPFRLISVWGEGSTLTADVIVNGVRMSVRKGDELPDGWLVFSIDRGTMSIRRGAQRLAMKLGS